MLASVGASLVQGSSNSAAIPSDATTEVEEKAKHALTAFYALGFLARPNAFLMTVFIFDSPIKSPVGFALAVLVTFSVWCYPAFWATGLCWAFVGETG